MEENLTAQPLTILIAEPEACSSQSLELAFQQEAPDYCLAFVTTGEEVIDYLQGHSPFLDEECRSPALLLLDLNLPLMDGFQVLQWLAAFPEKRPSHVITMAESNDEAAIDRAWALGSDGCLTRNLPFEELCAQIRALAEMLQPNLPEVPAPV